MAEPGKVDPKEEKRQDPTQDLKENANEYAKFMEEALKNITKMDQEAKKEFAKERNDQFFNSPAIDKICPSLKEDTQKKTDLKNAFKKIIDAQFEKGIPKEDGNPKSMEDVLNDLTDPNSKSQFTLTDEEKAALKTFKEGVKDTYSEDYKKFMEEQNILKVEGLAKDLITKLDKVDTAAAFLNIVKEAQAKVEDLLPPEEFKKREQEFETRRGENIKASMEKGGSEAANTSYNRVSYKDILKYVVLLLGILGTLAGVGVWAWWMLVQADALDGCQMISCVDGDVFPVSNQTWCFGTANPSLWSSLNLDTESQGIKFDSSNCTCDPPKNNDNSSCSFSTCEINSNGENSSQNVRPFNNKCNPGDKFQCTTDIIKCPLRYYSYSIMDPASAFSNWTAGVDNGFHKDANAWVELLIKIGIWAGIIIGSLILIWAIYKSGILKRLFVKSKPAIEEAKAISEFGKYLGNIQKYSNYAYMGRCAVNPMVPYIPTRFKI